MARNPRELIACGDCGALNEEATLLLAQAKADIEGLEKDLRGKRAKITQLTHERWQKLRDDKRYGEAMVVLTHWRDVCSPRAREIDSPDRLAAVYARLRGGHSIDELKRCADGYAKRPFVTKQGRSASGKPSEWYADAELIYRSAEHVRKGIALAETPSISEPQAESLPSGSIERLSWRKVQSANRALLIRALTKALGKGLEDHNGFLLWPCPKCNNHPACTLRVAPPGMSWLAECSSCGMTETRLIAAITGDTNE